MHQKPIVNLILLAYIYIYIYIYTYKYTKRIIMEYNDAKILMKSRQSVAKEEYIYIYIYIYIQHHSLSTYLFEYIPIKKVALQLGVTNFKDKSNQL